MKKWRRLWPFNILCFVFNASLLQAGFYPITRNCSSTEFDIFATDFTE
jgi:hypothetical protein